MSASSLSESTSQLHNDIANYRIHTEEHGLKDNIPPPAIAAIVVVVVLILGFFAFRTMKQKPRLDASHFDLDSTKSGSMKKQAALEYFRTHQNSGVSAPPSVQ